MATDYYKMGSDLGGAYFDGREEGRLRQRQIDADARVKLMQGREDEAHARKMGMQVKEDAAYGSLEALNGGVYDGAQTDFGAAPVEQGMRGPSPQPAPMPVTAPGAMRKGTDREFNQANMGVAVATRNLAQQTALRGESKKLDIGDSYQSTIAKMSKDPEFFNSVMKNVTLNSQRMLWDAGMDEKGKQTGPRVLSLVQDDGRIKKFTPTGAQDKAVALAMAHIENGDVTNGLNMLHAVDKDVAEAAARELNSQIDVGKLNQGEREIFDRNTHNAGTLAETQRNNQARSAQDAAELTAMELYRKDSLRQQAAGQNRPQYLQLLDDKGEAVVVDQGKLKTGPDGRLMLPAGLKFPRQRPEIDYRAVEARAAALEGKPMPGLAAGKPRVYTGEDAYVAAMNQLYPQRPGAAGGQPEVAAPARGYVPAPATTSGTASDAARARFEPTSGLQRGPGIIDPVRNRMGQ